MTAKAISTKTYSVPVYGRYGRTGERWVLGELVSDALGPLAFPGDEIIDGKGYRIRLVRYVLTAHIWTYEEVEE